MKPVEEVVACVIDHGLFLPIAQKLGEQFKKVYYWSPWDDVAPKLERGLVGDGFKTIERVDSPWLVKSKCDVFIFPDIGFKGEQRELLRQGYPVWGHHGADELETQRGLFLGQLKELGMLVPKYEKVVGITALKERLRNEKDKWIKMSRWRGDWETLHWRDWEHDELTLDGYAYRFGPLKDKVTLYVFDSIDTDIEDGMDTFCIDGHFPEQILHGIECKDRSYLCAVQPMRDLDERVRIVPEKFGPVLREYSYRSFFTCEVRIKDDQSYFIDPTCRAGSPPSQLMTEMIANLGEVMWKGAQGILVEPEYTAPFGVQALIKCEREACDWEVLDIPDEIRQWVKCGFACEVDGKICIPPHPLGGMIGWLVATGDTIEEAIDNLKEYRKELPDGLDCDVDSLAKLLQEAEEAKEQGIEFTDKKLPKPEVVL